MLHIVHNREDLGRYIYFHSAKNEQLKQIQLLTDVKWTEVNKFKVCEALIAGRKPVYVLRV